MNNWVMRAVHDEIRSTYEGGGAALAVIELAPADSDADGVLYVRTAASGALAAKSACCQYDGLARTCKVEGLKPRLLVLAAGISGSRPFAERADFAAIFDAVDEGCTWVMTSDEQRLARNVLARSLMLEASHGCGLQVFCPDARVLTNIADPKVRAGRASALGDLLEGRRPQATVGRSSADRHAFSIRRRPSKGAQ